MTNPFDAGAIGDVYVNVSSRVKDTDARKAVADIDAIANKEFTRLGQENGENWSNNFVTEVKKVLGADGAGKPTYAAGSISNMMRGSIGNAARDAVKDAFIVADDVVVSNSGNRAGGVFGRGFGATFRTFFRDFFAMSGLFNFDASPVLKMLKPITEVFSSASMSGSVGGPIIQALQAILQVSAMGTMVAYITGAVYGLQSFISLLYIVPGLIASITSQVVTLFFVFHGLGTVIGQVFQAKNIQEVDTALQGVNQTVATQLRQLFFWKEAFSEIAKQAQPAFFGAIGSNRLTEVLNNIKPSLASGVTQIAAALGRVFDQILQVLANPAFARLMDVITNSTVKWLDGFGPALGRLITGFDELAIAVAPFMDWFGEKFNKALTDFGDAMARAGQNKDFMDFLETAKTLMPEFIHLLGAAVALIIIIVQKFHEADDAFKSAFGIDFLTFLKQALEGLSEVIDIFGKGTFTTAIEIMAALVFSFFSFLVAFMIVAAAIQGIFAAIHDFIVWAGTGIGNLIYDLTHPNENGQLKKRWDEALGAIRETFSNVLGFIRNIPQEAWNALVSLGDKVRDAIGNLAQSAYDGGLNLMNRLRQGIVDGAKGVIGAIGDAMRSAADHWLGHSPVRVGPLSGTGDPYLGGKLIVDRLALGMKDATPGLVAATNNVTSTIVFGPGAIQNNYNNANPANAAAHAAAMYGQFAGMVSRDTRLGVRALGGSF